MANYKNGIIIFSLLSFAKNVFSEEYSAKATIQEFYKRYLNYNYHLTPNIPCPELKFSKSFYEEIEKNRDICNKYSEGAICGWAANSNEYLNTQDQDENLNYNNSSIEFIEIYKNTIKVSLNVFPFEKNIKEYQTVITYKMLKENGQWVADDVIYQNRYSSREKMKKENEYSVAHSNK